MAFILKPIKKAVKVVPIFAPMIINIACLKFISLALVKDMVRAMVPEELCNKMVAAIPVSTPLSFVFVCFFIISLI
jgi:hypothetical protein